MSIKSGDEIDGVVLRGEGDIVVESEFPEIAAAVADTEFGEQLFGVVSQLLVT